MGTEYSYTEEVHTRVRSNEQTISYLFVLLKNLVDKEIPTLNTTPCTSSGSPMLGVVFDLALKRFIHTGMLNTLP